MPDLDISECVLGQSHPDTATSLDNLAGLLEAQVRPMCAVTCQCHTLHAVLLEASHFAEASALGELCKAGTLTRRCCHQGNMIKPSPCTVGLWRFACLVNASIHCHFAEQPGRAARGALRCRRHTLHAVACNAARSKLLCRSLGPFASCAKLAS